MRDVTRKWTGHRATDEWLDKQPIWHDRDVVKFVAVTLVIGFGIGFLFGWSAGQPDLSGIINTGIKG